MSTYLYTSFLPKEKEQYPELFNRLFNWVKQKGIDIEIEEILDSADYTKYPIQDVGPIKVLDSKVKNSVSFTYSRLKPYEIYGDLQLVGNKYGLGYMAKASGNIKIFLNERSIWGSRIRHYLANEEYEKIEEHKVAVLIGLSGLFNEWIELCEDLLQHASFYTEGKLRSRITSTMGYYTSCKDFILDYSRILIDAYTEHHFPEYIGQEAKYLQSLGTTINDEVFYNTFKDEERGDLITLIKKLYPEFINSLNDLSENTIKDSLWHVLKKNNEIIFSETRYGFTLCTYPLSSLWPLYSDLLRELQNTGKIGK